MSKLYLAQLIADGNRASLASTDVYDSTQAKTLDVIIAEILASIAGIDSSAVTSLQNDLSSLQDTVSTFLTGADNNDNTLNRLSELVAAIQNNATLIGDISTLSGNVESLSAAILALQNASHSHSNQTTILDNLSRNAETGNLVFNNKELTGETGIAIGATADAATDYTAKLQIVIQEITIEDAPADEGGSGETGGSEGGTGGSEGGSDTENTSEV